MGERILMTWRVTKAERATVKRRAKAAGFADVASYLRHLTGLPPAKEGRPPSKKPKRPRRPTR